jgi:DNA-binding SARP family transcriptional activator
MLSIRLLGGFRAERIDLRQPVRDWKRRSAKALTKLLATHPGHALHREQILDILWPDLDLESALNSFGKALHAARRALEPELVARASSQYLRLSDSVLSLNVERVVIDADCFQQLAVEALRHKKISAYECALDAYRGELLPEDRYEDWSAERREHLSELHVRLLLGLAEALEAGGIYDESADRLRQVLDKDATREDAHRRLMRVCAAIGDRDGALRQFHLCQDALRRELGLAPQQETISLYQDLLEDRVRRRSLAPSPAADDSRPLRTANRIADTQFVGRTEVLRHLHEQLSPPNGVRAGLVLLTGEAGVGKTRLLAQFAGEANRAGTLVLWGGTGAHANHLACGPVAVALEDYVASCPSAERREIALRYPALARCLPSLPADDHRTERFDCQDDLPPTIARLLTDLGRTQPVLLALGDVQDIDSFNCQLLRYLAHLSISRPWLIIGAFREEEIEARTELQRTIQSLIREGLCTKLELRCLSREACDELVRGLLAGERVGGELLGQVYAGSRGNPLLVEELVHELRDRAELGRDRRTGPAAVTSCGPARVPARIQALVAMRLERLEDTVRRVLALVAVAGAGEIPLEKLRTGAATLEPPICDAALFDALDYALLSGVLEEREGGYAFRHPLVRSALCEGLPHHRRAELDTALRRARGANSGRLRVAATR